MEINESLALTYSIRYAKKFGFISKSFFWDHFCTRSRATNFRYWKSLLNSGAFLPYKEFSGVDEYYYLNTKSALASQVLIESVGKRSSLYLYHDEQAMRFIASLEKLNLIKNFWTELELKCDRSLSYRVLGGEPNKVPDLVFDLNCPGETFRTALEIEATRKSKEKYYKSVLGYSDFKKIDLILYGISQSTIATAINGEINRSYFSKLKSKIAFYFLSEFKDSGTSCGLKINSRSISIENFYKNIVDLKTKTSNLERDKTETPVSPSFSENKGSL